MDWRDDRWKPSRKQYKRFEKDLSKKSSHRVFESGLLIFLTMLFLIPLSVFLLACASGMFGEQARVPGAVIVLLGVAGVLTFQAHRGLVRRKVRVLPKSRIQNESAYVGGKVSDFATGRDAVIVGSLFLAAAVACLAAALRTLLGLL